jgi:uncharacterized membrane protein
VTERNKLTLKAYIVPVAVGFLIIIIFGSYWFIFRRKYA